MESRLKRFKPFCIPAAHSKYRHKSPVPPEPFFFGVTKRGPAPAVCRFISSTDPPISGGIRHLLHWSVTFTVYFTSSAESCRPLVSIKFFYYVIIFENRRLLM